MARRVAHWVWRSEVVERMKQLSGLRPARHGKLDTLQRNGRSGILLDRKWRGPRCAGAQPDTQRTKRSVHILDLSVE